MFTTNHFIWLGICVFIIGGMLVLCKFKKLSFDIVLNLIVIVATLSEITKIFANMEEAYGGGRILDPGDLPFHLCSIQIFFIYALKFLIKSEETKKKLLSFMAPTLLFGGLVALFIPTVGVKFTRPQVYQFFIYHAFIVFFAIYLIKEKLVNKGWKSFVQNVSFLGVLTVFALWINSILSKTNEKVNFFYLSRPPMENLPILNLNNGWFAYFFTLIGIVVSLLAIYQLIINLLYKKIEVND